MFNECQKKKTPTTKQPKHTWVEGNRVWLPKNEHIQDFIYPEIHVSVQVISNGTGPWCYRDEHFIDACSSVQDAKLFLCCYKNFNIVICSRGKIVAHYSEAFFYVFPFNWGCYSFFYTKISFSLKQRLSTLRGDLWAVLVPLSPDPSTLKLTVGIVLPYLISDSAASP